MTIPSPYLASNKELIPLSKGVPATLSYQERELVSFTVYVDGRIAIVTRWYPIYQIPSLHLVVNGLNTSRVRSLFTLQSWRRGFPDVVSVPVSLPVSPLPKAGKIRVRIPGPRGVIPAAVRKARRRVNSVRKGRVPKKSFPRRPASVRPSPETYTRPWLNVSEGNNGGYFLTSTPSSYTRYSRVWSGVRTPNFGKLKKTLLPVNAHGVRLVETTDGPGIYQNFIPSTGIYFNRFGTFTLFYAVPPDFQTHMPEAQFKALRKLIEKAQSGIDANLAQDFAQIGQTVSLITNTVKRLTKAVTSLKNGNIPSAVQHLWSGHLPRYNGKGPSVGKSAASNWLEMQYGWKPLIQDVHGAMNSLISLNISSPFIQRVTASAVTDQLNESDIMHRTGVTTKAGKHYYYLQTRCKYMVRYKIDDKLKLFLSQTGFTNPVNLLWEILPFSFVVDWFAPIGPFLETLSSWDGLSFHSGSVVQFTRATVNSSVSFAGAVPQAPGQLWEERARYTRQVTILDRTKLTAFPSAYMPSGFKNGLASITHAENALALMRSAFR